jgi:antitoxin component YwqK of YwqJK toxin-antitoxin module
MKLSHLLLVLGASGLAVSVYALQGRKSDGPGDQQTTYYSNGQIRSETAYQDGHMEGPSTRYYSDGKKLATGTYQAGKMEGEWVFWKADGALDMERSGTYVAGEKQAASTARQPSGN